MDSGYAQPSQKVQVDSQSEAVVPGRRRSSISKKLSESAIQQFPNNEDEKRGEEEMDSFME